MSLSLYRKYRPQTFAEVVGQNHIKTTLQNEIVNDQLAHAYLFSGPRGLGKTTVARLLAKSVNCLNRKPGESEPCNDCDSCREIMNHSSLDVLEIDAASHTGVDNVRENIITAARFTPASRKYKVFIIDEVHMLSLSAFNALLKTLEEPPARVLFILATTESHKVPETIFSRCQHFDFRKVPTVQVVARLASLVSQEKKKISQSVLEQIAGATEGCLRDAESLLGQLLSLGDKEITDEQAELLLPRMRVDDALALIRAMDQGDAASALTTVNQLVDAGISVERFTDDLIELLRLFLLITINPNLEQYGVYISPATLPEVQRVASVLDRAWIVRALDILVRRRPDFKDSAIVQLPLEMAVIEIIGGEPIERVNAPAARSVAAKPVSALVELKPIEPVKAEIVAPEVITPVEPPKSAVKAEKESKIEKTEQKDRPAKTVSVTLDVVKKKWHDILVAVAQHNQSLATALKISNPSNVDAEGVLELTFEHRFHGDRINEQKNRTLLESIFLEIFGSPMRIRTIVVENAAAAEPEVPAFIKQQRDDSADSIAQSFGGQVLG